jgi:uncharacterized membrane protein YdfJ with MMPL/SSD domain
VPAIIVLLGRWSWWPRRGAGGRTPTPDNKTKGDTSV